ncbi:hypothetical protein HELRODRAFT_184149 [Helobdella robusta]|uniref:Uncharacterized protein n=1 Tax=Helobdella robusta TaxID=6412 RepID=T1FKP0_HELRO|nr:hypothetical protein HELRODRAFT_184149 [Helobdella robusta]ESO07067.1 hypothetical protein HELRODRAFT_184149 [Helobdella robusta]
MTSLLCRCYHNNRTASCSVMQNAPRTKCQEGLFLHVGYSSQEQVAIETGMGGKITDDVVSVLLSMFLNSKDVYTSASNSVECKVLTSNTYKGNFLFKISSDNNVDFCIEKSRNLARLINERNKVLTEIAELSILKVAQLEYVHIFPSKNSSKLKWKSIHRGYEDQRHFRPSINRAPSIKRPLSTFIFINFLYLSKLLRPI